METETEEIYRFKDRQDWFLALQEAPNPSWLKTRDLGKRKSSYIPLAIQQAVADLLFQEFDTVEEKYTLIQNELMCTIKIQFLPSYPNSEHRFMTGTGAKPIQQVKNSVASLFPDGKITNAIEYNAPAARAAAMSNALTSFANIFGRNLSREVPNNFSFFKNEAKDEKK